MIVVAGEALIDLVPSPQAAPPSRQGTEGAPTSDDRLPALLPRRGGGPYNTAVALGRLGSPAAFCSRISTDSFGEALLQGLVGGGVDTSLVQRGSEPTTLAVADISPDGSAGYGFYADGTADRLFTLPPALPAGVRALSLGTCSLVLEPGASAYESLLRREARRGVFTALDPNIRAGLIPDPDAYRARFRSWLPDLALLKLSEEDALWLAGAGDGAGDGAAPGDAWETVAAAAQEWLAAGPAAIVLTRGGDGLTVLRRGGGELTVPGERVTVVDTIGAGDTVNAALLHRLDAHGALSYAAVAALGDDDWRDILRFAARAAAVTCSRAGAEPPFATELAA
ncbi:carbohydrate kinase [Streptomyces sp. NPDC048516]|uniref:carbohydrate kinase family protein n=1 Tax=Streptomyces sp. NPDC048516 TaxID=3365565 RepID=UPI0037147D03